MSSNLVTPASANPTLDAAIQDFVDGVRETPVSSGAARVDTLTLPVGPTGTVVVTIVRPLGIPLPLPIVLYCHGGGWISGCFTDYDRLVRDLAVGVGAAVVFVEYELAPGVVFPIQNEQAYAALDYMVEHAEAMCLDGTRLAVAGDGAGGNMAAAVTLMARRRRRPEIAFQLLLCPTVDMPRDTGSYATFADGPGLTKADMASAFAAQFPANSPIDILARPLRATEDELYGLPAALVITAENDVLRDEGESYARKLMQAGVAVTATRYIGTIHGFATLDGVAGSSPARAALSQSISALREAIGLSLVGAFQNNPAGK